MRYAYSNRRYPKEVDGILKKLAQAKPSLAKECKID